MMSHSKTTRRSLVDVSAMDRYAPGRKGGNRDGLSLLEVILSIAILGGSMVMIGNLYHLGYRSALQAQMRNDANIHASATMAELVAGVIPIEATGSSEISGSPGWYYSVDIQNSLQPGLFMATVIVSRGESEEASSSAVSLVRFIPDPDYEPEEEEE